MRSGGVASSSRRRTIPGGSELIPGNFQTYGKNPYGAYTGMWGINNPQSPNIIATSSMRVTPDTFPDGTIFSWDVTPDPNWGGVNGFLHVSYGNYDASPGQIIPRQVKNITDLTVNTNWTYAGDSSTGLLCELWLSPAAAPSGSFTKSFEIAFFPKFSPGSRIWLDSLPQVGAGFAAAGANWLVREAGSGGSESIPYLIAYRSDYGDVQGAMPFSALFAYLTAAGKITGNEWFNGVAFGPEPQSGAASLTINNLSVSYAGA